MRFTNFKKMPVDRGVEALVSGGEVEAEEDSKDQIKEDQVSKIENSGTSQIQNFGKKTYEKGGVHFMASEAKLTSLRTVQWQKLSSKREKFTLTMKT